jgi:hypothetical protein
MHATLLAHDQKTYRTVKLLCNVESHKAANDGTKAQCPCSSVRNKRPLPRSLSRVHFPLEANCSNIFPSVLDLSRTQYSRRTWYLTNISRRQCARLSRRPLDSDISMHSYRKEIEMVQTISLQCVRQRVRHCLLRETATIKGIKQ